MSDSEYENDDINAGLTSVILGFPGRETTLDDYTALDNHIGGSPLWLHNKEPSAELLKCKVCSHSLKLLAQLNCPLPEKDYDRVLYAFACTTPDCRRKEGSIRAIRGIESNDTVRRRIIKEIEESKPENSLAVKGDLGDSLFSSSAAVTNPFGNPTEQLALASEKATKPAKTAPKKKSKSKKLLRIVEGTFICKLIEAEEEYLEIPELDQKLQGVKIEEMETEPEAASSSSTASNGISESSVKELESRADPVFAHFIEIVESNPEQLLRYERGLKPLLYSGTDGVPEKLKSLDAEHKVLEVQLMPHLIAELETEDMIVDGMEWGSIFIATDADDKLPDLDENGVGYVEEWVAVQWE